MITKEGLLTQLGCGVTDATLAQIDRVLANTPGLENNFRHVVALQDHLKPYDAFITLSSTNDYLKIKNDTENQDLAKAADETINQWSKKYKIEVKRVYDKPTYYIIGIV